MKMKLVKVMVLAAVVAAGFGVFGEENKASAMASYGGYTPKTLGEACEMAYWYYFLR
jgi:hypothetical protein